MLLQYMPFKFRIYPLLKIPLKIYHSLVLMNFILLIEKLTFWVVFHTTTYTKFRREKIVTKQTLLQYERYVLSLTVFLYRIIFWYQLHYTWENTVSAAALAAARKLLVATRKPFWYSASFGLPDSQGWGSVSVTFFKGSGSGSRSYL